jgi:cytoskeletal protein RodZ
MLIALAATVLVAASWMMFLRPRAVESTTEQVTAPARVADKARAAAAATDKASAATEAATADADEASGATPAKGTTPTKGETSKVTPSPTAKKAAAPAPVEKKAETQPVDGQAAVLADMDAKKVVVLFFWDRAGADDRAAHDAVEAVNRRDGKVAVHVVDVKDVGRYESVTQGVNVAQSPTTIIISRDAKARTIPGLTDPTEIDQMVREALAAK